jgi:amino acid adenylation domain-containing protein
MLLLAAFDVLLRKLSNQEDIIVGTPIAGRNHADLQNLVGMFVNMLLIRNFPTDTKKFTHFLNEVKQQTLNAYENQEFPFDDLVESLAVPRDTSRNPLFDVTFNLLDERNYQYEISEDNEQTGLIYLKGTSRFDLSLMVIDRGHGLVFRFEYSTRLFKPETMERFLRYFKNILSAISVSPWVKISDIEILPESEKEKILEMCYGIEVPYDTGLSVHRLFEEQTTKTPDHIALVGVHETHKKHEKKYNMSFLSYMSYKELNKKSNQLARYLVEKGARSDTIVGIMIERSLEMIIGIMAILKAQAAYLPIDPEYPQDRIDFMLKDSDTKILLTSREIPNLSSPEAFNNSPKGTSSHLHLSPAPVTSLAYIIYTSGTTGQPKGVAVDHRSLINLCHWHNRYYEVTSQDQASQFASFCFDASVWEIFPYLAAGATLHIIEDRIKTDIYQVDSYFHRHGITIGFLPTPAAEQLMLLPESKSKRHLRALLTGGDQLRTFVPQPYSVYNNYGPTENTVVTTSGPVKNLEENIPIGKPVYNNQVYILKPHSPGLQPIGVPGELCIAGHSLARGYLNNPELTAEKFLFVFYRSYMSYKSYIYRSGDLARWLPDGNIQFMGRIDQQVKIRGFRVEPAEVEKHLNNHSQIKESVVITIEKNREKYLCAYVVTNKNLDASSLKDFLFKRLPGYMVPGFFVQLDKIPLTPHGKIDRKALPPPALETKDQYTPPRNDIERKLVKIWSEILQLPSSPGIDDNFFDQGGHSLKATVLAARIHQELDVKVPLAILFKQPSIKALAEFIKKVDKDRFFGIEPVEEREYYPLSPAQKRLYILQQMDPGNVVYNMPVTLLLEGELDKKLMEKVFRRLIRKHDSLRTSFHMIDNQPVQKIEEEVKVKIKVEEIEGTRGLAPLPKEPATRNPQPATALISSFIQPFDLSMAPLLRVALIHTPPFGHPSQEGNFGEKYILVVDMHHIISDGISMNILVKEFMLYFGSKEFPPLQHPIQYKDYSQWFHRQRETGYFKKQEAYWLNEFSYDIPCLDLPLDYPRPAVYHFEGSRATFELEEEQTRQLRQRSRELDSTLFMILMALLNVLLAKLNGQEDIVVGSPIAGRPHSQLQDIIGMFVNTLALKNHPSPEKTFQEFLAEIKQKSLAAFENQVYPFEELVEKVVVSRDTGRNPLFDLMLVVQNLESQELEIPGLPIRPYPFEIEISKFDMTWTVMETEKEDRLDFTIVYCTRLFKPGTINRFWGYFRQIVETVLQNPGILLADIEIITPAEKQEILYGFNHENARIGYPTGKTIHQLFAKQSERTPDHIGIKLSEGTRGLAPLSGPMSLTYGKLNQQSSQLAHCLKAKGIQPDTIVAIMVEPSIEMIIGILGILKAGGAYMPIDPDYPQDRIDYMLKDSDAKILLTSHEISDLSSPEAFNICPKGASSHLHLSPAPATCLAYIIYTSGTTGRPKGSLIDHRNVVRLMTNDRFQFDFNDNDVWTLFHSYCFDFSVWEMYGALLYGGKLVIIPRMTAKDSAGFLEVLKQEKVTVLNQTPSAFYQLMTQESKVEDKELNLKYIIFGGEALNPAKLKAWNQRYPETRLINMYGITETTVHVTYKEILEQDMESPASCIGLPIPTLTTYIVDRHLNLQPLGVPGELWVGGQGVSRGYLNRPELTAEKFCLRRPGGALFVKTAPVKHPDASRKNFLLKGAYRSYGSYKSYIYRTGDLARWLPDGDIEYLGRIDQQVKIRGHRIELGEIEHLLLKLKDVKEAVVIAKEDQMGDRYLCAYIVAKSKAQGAKQGETSLTIDSAELRSFLSKQLPGYMIPSFFAYLEEIPLTPNGKIHRQALPDPVFQKGESYRAPGNNIEKKLVEIWKDILMQDPSASIGIDDNFFELGGHSLKAIGVVNAVHKAFNVQMSIQDIFIAPTIGELASIISQREISHFAEITPLPQREYYELSYAQARLWVLHKRDPRSPAFNMPERVTFHEKIEVGIIRDVLAQLAARHEALRTYFTEIEGQVVQKIAPQVFIDVKMIDFSHFKEDELYKLREQIFAGESLILFDLGKAPLLRVKLVKYQEEEFDLIFTMHHLVSDGWSLEVLHREFYRYYKAIKEGRTFMSEPVKVQYKDYAHWHNHLLADREKLNEVLEFWRPQLIEPPILELPYDPPEN